MKWLGPIARFRSPSIRFVSSTMSATPQIWVFLFEESSQRALDWLGGWEERMEVEPAA